MKKQYRICGHCLISTAFVTAAAEGVANSILKNNNAGQIYASTEADSHAGIDFGKSCTGGRLLSCAVLHSVE